MVIKSDNCEYGCHGSFIMVDCGDIGLHSRWGMGHAASVAMANSQSNSYGEQSPTVNLDD